MGWPTPAGQVYTLVHQESLNGLHSIEFLTHLLRATRKRVLVAWDGSPIHRRAAVAEFATGILGKVWLEGLLGYDPGPVPVGRGRLKPPEERPVAEHGVPGPRGVA